MRLKMAEPIKPSAHMAPDQNEDCGEHDTCSRCGGEGTIMLSEAGPGTWGEDCFCDIDRAIVCPNCRGSGEEK